MQTESTKLVTLKRTSLTPNFDTLVLDPHGRGSVEYARARDAINQDYKLNFAGNQPLAKRYRKASKEAVVEYLKGTVGKNKENKLIVTFPDGSIANL